MTTWQNLNLVRVNSGEAKTTKNGSALVRGTLVRPANGDTPAQYINFTASGATVATLSAMAPGSYVSALLSETNRKPAANGSPEMWLQGVKFLSAPRAKATASA